MTGDTETESTNQFAVYRYWDHDGRLIYIGSTKNVAQRDAMHRSGKSGTWWYPLVAEMRVQLFATIEAAREAELLAIAEEQPAFNQRGTERPPGDRSHWTESDHKAERLWHDRPGNYKDWWLLMPVAA